MRPFQTNEARAQRHARTPAPLHGKTRKEDTHRRNYQRLGSFLSSVMRLVPISM
jgi:hypothetical protein